MAINYQALLAGDTGLQDALKAINAQDTSYQDQLRAARQRAIAMFGAAPDSIVGGYTGVSGVIDPFTRDLADQATRAGISTWAQLQHAANVQHASTLNNIASHGFASYGGLAPHLGEDQRVANLNQYNATQSLLDQLHGYYNDYLGQQGDLNQQRAAATSAAMNTIIAKINAGLLSSGLPKSNVAAPTGGLATNPSDAAGRPPMLAAAATRARTAAHQGFISPNPVLPSFKPSLPYHSAGSGMLRVPTRSTIIPRNRYADVGTY